MVLEAEVARLNAAYSGASKEAAIHEARGKELSTQLAQLTQQYSGAKEEVGLGLISCLMVCGMLGGMCVCMCIHVCVVSTKEGNE